MVAMVKNPQFEGQTKGRLGNTEVRPLVEAIVTQQLTAYFERPEKSGAVPRSWWKRPSRAAHVREAARKARDVARHQERAGGRAAGGQAGQLHRPQAGAERAVHRRGRQRRRQRQAGPRPPFPGHPAPARQAAERREKAAWTRCSPTRNSARLDHRAGHQHRRGLQPERAEIP